MLQVQKACPCLGSAEELSPEEAKAAAEATAGDVAAAFNGGGVMMHKTIGLVAIGNAVALPVLQIYTRSCSSGIFGWIPFLGDFFRECEVSSHFLHLFMASCNLVLVLVLTTIWDPTNEARGSIREALMTSLTALPSLFGRCSAFCRENVLAKLPMPDGIRETLLPDGVARSDDAASAAPAAPAASGKAVVAAGESSDDDDDDDDDSDDESGGPPAESDEEKGKADKKKKKGPPVKLPEPEKLPPPSPASSSPSKGNGKKKK
jgi:hypothetical protein